MKRALMAELIKWKDRADRKPLILKGVRQCGKTYLLQEFGERCFDNSVYLNFEENDGLKKIFENDFDVKRILFEISLFTGKKIEAGKTLLFFDEIQECGRALTAMKYFCENAREYHIVCAGSLLGIALRNEQSFPVGKVDFLTLYPMSFREFLRASGEEGLADFLDGFGRVDRIPEECPRS